MEWLVPVLFVVVSLAQWWLKRQKQGREELPVPAPHQDAKPNSDENADPFGEFGDLLEALGRRRHESPPSPAVIPSQPVTPSRKELNLPPPVFTRAETSHRPSPPALSKVIRPTPPSETLDPARSFPQAKAATLFVPTLSPSQGVRRYPWREKIHQPGSIREALVLSEILALPVALR